MSAPSIPATPLAAKPFRNATLALLCLAMPMVGMQVSRMLVNNIDTVMVGQLGTSALAAIAPATLLLFAVSCVGMGMAQAVQTFVSQVEGRGEPHRAGVYVWQSIHIAILSAIVTSPIVITVPYWFRWFGQFFGHPADVLEMEITFLTIALWSVAPATACVGVESFFNGIRRPMIGLIAVVASLITIVIANYALIFGHFGFPRMGIAGSAWATILSWIVRLTVVMLPLIFSRALDERYHVRRGIAPSWTHLREIVRVGSPISFQWLVDIGAWVVFLQVMMPRYGAIAMAAATIAIQCMHLAFMPALGIGMALTTQVGNAIGAGRPDQAVGHVHVARRVIVGYMGFMAALFVLVGRPLAMLFDHSNPAVTTATVYVLIWCALFQISDAICITYSFALRGAGDTRAPALLFAVCCWGIFVVGGLVVVHWLPQLGPYGPWMMCMTYIIVLGFLLWQRFNSGAWRKVQLFKGADAQPGGFPVIVDAARATSESPNPVDSGKQLPAVITGGA